MEIKRKIIDDVIFLKEKYPILAITGPRQSGKTTFLKEFFPNYDYVSLENPINRALAQNDPSAFFKKYNSFCIIDEAQRVPEIFSFLQDIVDTNKIMGQYIISGSQNFHLLKGITQSLAGRVALFKLFPFDFHELKSENLLSKDYIKAMIKGFYPALYDRNIPSSTFYSNYLQTYVERDITEVLNIKDLRTFRTFITLCASRSGQLLNLNALANECGITQPTAKSWISVLESSYIVFLLQPYHKNFDKRVIKSPKLYFYDTGLLCHLLKIKDENQVKFQSYKGHLFENMIVAEKVKQKYHTNSMDDLWFFRDAAGHEVDLIVQKYDALEVIEIKATETIPKNLFNELLYFEKLSNEIIDEKNLIYAGDENQIRSAGNVLSWYDL